MIKLEFKTRGKIITRYEVFSNVLCILITFSPEFEKALLRQKNTDFTGFPK